MWIDGWAGIWTGTDRQTDMTNLILSFVNYVNASYNIQVLFVIKIYNYLIPGKR
jgi:hypothetical protein